MVSFLLDESRALEGSELLVGPEVTWPDSYGVLFLGLTDSHLLHAVTGNQNRELLLLPQQKPQKALPDGDIAAGDDPIRRGFFGNADFQSLYGYYLSFRKQSCRLLPISLG